METAEGCTRWPGESPELTLLVGPQGQIHIIAASEWPLDNLRRERGAAVAYRVSRSGGRVAVEGRSFSRTCRLESESPAVVARRLLGGTAPASVAGLLPA